MADGTKIEWADATLNYANGCSLASPGCTNCYAMKQAHRFPVRQGLTQQSKGGMVWTGEVRMNDKALHQALAWKRGRKIFWNAHGDLFHENVTDAQIDRLFAVCALTPQHTHMILTKRSARMREYLTRVRRDATRRTAIYASGARMLSSADPKLREAPPAFPLPNVWLGVSVEDQQRADERIPDLLTTPAAVRFISAEPLLGSVHIRDHWLIHHHPGDAAIDWIIVGGESGPKARPMHPDWARSLRDQCQAAGVPMLFKQWGEWSPREWKADGGTHAMHCLRSESFQKIGHHPDSIERTTVEDAWQAFAKIGKAAAGRMLDGREWTEFPA